jgi:hypothetical protein
MSSYIPPHVKLLESSDYDVQIAVSNTLLKFVDDGQCLTGYLPGIANPDIFILILS